MHSPCYNDAGLGAAGIAQIERRIFLDKHPCIAPMLGRTLLILETVVITSRRYRGRTLNELRRVMARFARGWALGRIAANLGLQFGDVGEDIGLPPQLVGDHRRLA